MIERLILVTLLIFSVMMIVVLSLDLIIKIYLWKNKDKIPTKEEWRIM